MAKSTSKRRVRTSAQSASKTSRPAKAAAKRAQTRRPKAALKAARPAAKAGKRPKKASAASARKAQPRAASSKRRPAAAKATPKARVAASGRRPGTPTAKAARPRVAPKAARPAPKRPPATTVSARPAAKAAPKTHRVAQQPPAAPAPREAAPRPPQEAERVASIPSTLNYPSSATAARSGAEEIRSNRAKHTDTSPALTGGDIDATWEEASSTGDEAPGSDNLTPDQDVVDEIGSALGIEYADAEELQGGAELESRDRHRWEYDPASAEDYVDRLKNES